MAALRQGERAGRTRAERQLRELRQQGPAAASDANTAAAADTHTQGAAPVTVYPLRPIGTLRSVFSQRNGTPRQPLIVPLARAQLKLRPGIPRNCLEGLEQYTHCWLLYVFHENTDLGRLWRGGKEADQGLKAKVAVPRLDGGRMGVLATRSPHRPCPIGLSVARIVAVRGDTLILAGADVVNGTPVLDVKPYLPFCDSVPGAAAPHWVVHEAEVEPLQLAAVEIPPAAATEIGRCWRATQARGGSMYASERSFLALVAEALGRDIRSVHQRLGAGQVPNPSGGGAVPSSAPPAVEGNSPRRALESIGGAVTPLTGSVPGEHDRGGAQAVQGEQAAERVAYQGDGGARDVTVSGGSTMSVDHLSNHEQAAGEPAASQAHRKLESHQLEDVGLSSGRRSEDRGSAAGGMESDGSSQGLGPSAAGGVIQAEGLYHVVLEGVDISYDVVSTGVVHVRSATLWRPRQC